MAKLKLKKIPVTNRKDFDSPAIQPSVSPPSFWVGDKQMKEVANWEQGETYRLVVDVKMRSKNETEDGVEGGFDIVAYKHLKEKTIDEMSDEEFGEYQGEVLDKASS